MIPGHFRSRLAHAPSHVVPVPPTAAVPPVPPVATDPPVPPAPPFWGLLPASFVWPDPPLPPGLLFPPLPAVPPGSPPLATSSQPCASSTAPPDPAACHGWLPSLLLPHAGMHQIPMAKNATWRIVRFLMFASLSEGSLGLQGVFHCSKRVPVFAPNSSKRLNAECLTWSQLHPTQGRRTRPTMVQHPRARTGLLRIGSDESGRSDRIVPPPGWTMPP